MRRKACSKAKNRKFVSARLAIMQAKRENSRFYGLKSALHKGFKRGVAPSIKAG